MTESCGRDFGRRSCAAILSSRGLPSLTVTMILGLGLLVPSAATARRAHRTKRVTATVGTPVVGVAGGAGLEAGETSAPAPGESTGPQSEESGSGSGAPESPGQSEGAPRRVRRMGSCALQIEPNPIHVSAGEAVTVTGSLSCGSMLAPGEELVTIYLHSAGTPGFESVGTVAAEAGGSFHFTTEGLDTDSVIYASSLGSRSGRAHITVSPLVSVSGPPNGAQLVTAGQRSASGGSTRAVVRLTGVVTPTAAGAAVFLERAFGNEHWLTVSRGEVGAGGSYSVSHSFGIPGDARVRVLVRDHGHVAVSETLTYVITRPQRRALTIQASAHSLTYGEGLTLSGVLAGGGGVALELLASSASSGFIPVASTVSEEDGSYTFPTQSPQRDTSYRVVGEHKSSAVLLVAVKPALTANVSQTRVEPGTTIAFSGTITPARAGQQVSLERQDSGGAGFHVVASGEVAADGSFWLQHVVSAEGSQPFRVEVPGDREMEGVTSEAIEVDATRSP